jgi:3-oxoacid CoA-transferase B subunit
MTVERELTANEEAILGRAVRELRPGMVVNLGIGLPTFVPRFLPPGLDVILHSENGFVGMGPPVEGGTPDSNIIDAGGRACTILEGGAFFDSVMSFAIVRGGKLDLAILGAFEVSIHGDLANWKIPGKATPGMGGGMELAQKARGVLVLSHHLDKRGRAKLVERCKLPLTAPRCVDTLITERAVFRRRNGRLHLAGVHPDHTEGTALEGIEAEVEVADSLEAWG